MATREPRPAGERRPSGKFAHPAVSGFDEAQGLIESVRSGDFTLSIVRKDGRWLVAFADRESGNPAPSFGSGVNLEEASRKAGLGAAPD